MKRLSLFGLVLLSVIFISGAEAPKLFSLSGAIQNDAFGRPTNTVYSNGYREVVVYDPAGNVTLRQGFGPARATASSNVLTIIAGKQTEVPFRVVHDVLPISNIVVKAFSSNLGLLGTNAPPVVGTGTNRVFVVHPSGGVIGETIIALVASDGFVSSTNTFKLVVKPRPR